MAYQIFGAMEIGLIYALIVLGVLISFRMLDFPDLTVDGSFPMGAAIAAILIVSGVNPWLASICAFAGGCLAGSVTAYLNVRWNILHLLAGILTMTALYSINLRIMCRPNISLTNNATVFTPFEEMVRNSKILMFNPLVSHVLLAFVIVAIIGFILWRFLISEIGLGLRATGTNPRMARAQGVYTKRMIVLGVSLSNGLVALAGGLFAQSQGFADVGFGQSVIVTALASVIISEIVVPTRKISLMVIGCVLGSIIYRFFYAMALNTSFLGLQASDLNLVTSVMIGFAMITPKLRQEVSRSIQRRNIDD